MVTVPKATIAVAQEGPGIVEFTVVDRGFARAHPREGVPVGGIPAFMRIFIARGGKVSEEASEHRGGSIEIATAD